MSGPWEKYAEASPGPWTKYQAEVVSPAPSGISSMAAQAVGTLTEPVNPPAVRPGIAGMAQTVQRVWDATKSAFVPKSMRDVKNLLNPVAGRYGPSRLLEEEGMRVGGAVRAAGGRMAEDIATSRLANVSPNLAAGIGAAVSTAADVTSDSLTPSAFQQQIGMEGATGAGSEATQAARGKIADAAEKGAEAAGRRGLGFIQSELNKLRRVGGVERADAVAAEMIKQKVITPMATPDEMLGRAQALDQRMGNKIGEIITKLDKSGVSTSVDAMSLAMKIEEQLNMTAGKGATAAQKAAIREITDRVLETANPTTGVMNFTDTQGLKEIFQHNGNWASASDAFKAKVYRQASGIVNAELRKAIGAAGRELGTRGKTILDEYLAANLTKGKTKDAISALTKLTNKQSGNRFFDQFTTAGAIGGAVAAAASGKPVAGAALTATAILAKKFADNYGAQLTASGLNNLSQWARVRPIPDGVLTNPSLGKQFVSVLNRLPRNVLFKKGDQK